MANWITTINIRDLHDAFEDEKLSVSEVGLELSKRLKANHYGQCMLDLIDRLENVKDVEEYDDVLRELYDFGDFGHRIWFK